MSRRRRRSRRRSRPTPVGVYRPGRTISATRDLDPFSPYLESLNPGFRPLETPNRLVHTVSRTPVWSLARPRKHSRAHLMRTVFTDTSSIPSAYRRVSFRQAQPGHTLGLYQSATEPLIRTSVCARRQVRREVLFALDFDPGRGGSARKRKRSKVRC